MRHTQLLYISPEFPPNFQNFIRRLDEAGVEVFGIGEGDFYSLPEDIRKKLRWYERGEIRHSHELIRIIERMKSACPHLNADGSLIVESHNEFWLNSEAIINEHWNLDGPRSDLLSVWKHKSKMKQKFQDAGMKCARGMHTGSGYESVLNFASEASYPMILKPDSGVGAGGVHKILNEDHLRHVLEHLAFDDYFAEEWVEGQMYTYDGLTDQEGRVIFESSLIYSDGIIEYVNEGADPSFYVSRVIPEPLRDMGTKIVDIFGIKRKFFHIEFFKVGDEFLPVEVNCRAPGGPIIDMMNYSADCDLYRGYAEMIAGGTTDLPSQKRYYTGYIGRRDRKSYAHCHDSLIRHYGDAIINVQANPHVFREALADYFYIVRFSEEEDLLNAFREILRKE